LLFAFEMIHLRPINRACAEDVIEADVEHAGVESLYFTGQAVAVTHHDDIRFISCVERRREQKYAGEEDEGSDIHSVYLSSVKRQDILKHDLSEFCFSMTSIYLFRLRARLALWPLLEHLGNCTLNQLLVFVAVVGERILGDAAP
jgi:hypothetical protein